jgi:hypothetical protein
MISFNWKPRGERHVFYYSLIILFVFVSTGFSQNNITEDIVIDKNEKSNYIDGITSVNPGLKASCIYFAGRYRLNEAGSLLIEQLKRSNEEKLSLLIAWSIYRIGENDYLEELNFIAANHTSKRLKTFCAHLNQQKKFELTFEKSKQL